MFLKELLWIKWQLWTFVGWNCANIQLHSYAGTFVFRTDGQEIRTSVWTLSILCSSLQLAFQRNFVW